MNFRPFCHWFIDLFVMRGPSADGVAGLCANPQRCSEHLLVLITEELQGSLIPPDTQDGTPAMHQAHTLMAAVP